MFPDNFFDANYFIIVGTLMLIYLLSKIGKYVNDRHEDNQRLMDISEYEINTRGVDVSTVPEMLQSFIEECFLDYKVMVLVPRQEGYITTKREKEIRDELVSKVSRRMSQAFKDKMYLYYGKSKFDEVLADKIYIMVVNYVYQSNQTTNPGQQQ